MGDQAAPDVELAVDRLYGLPLEAFTQERNALAAQLKKQGDAEEAARIRALSKPTVVAWTINQVARRERAQLQDLLSAADDLRMAQEQAITGSGADELRRAQEAERGAVQALTRSARRILSEAGRVPSDAVAARISATLLAAMTDSQARRQVEQGRLETEVESAGFSPLTGLLTARRAEASQAKDELAVRRRRKADARERLRHLRMELREVRRRAREAEKQAEKLERDALAARGQAGRARDDVERVERALEEASDGQAPGKPR